MEALQPLGTVFMRRIYLSRHRARKWSKELKELSIEPRVVPSVLAGGKDPEDMALAWDVAATLAAHKRLSARKRLSAVAIASDDVDMALVHERIRSRNVASFALLRSNQGNRGVQRCMKAAASSVLLYNLTGDSRKAKPLRLRVDFRNRSRGIWADSGAAGLPESDLEACEKQLVSMLAQLGYWSAQVPVPPQDAPLPHDFQKGLSLAAVARFYYVHDLGPLTVFPKQLMIEEAHRRITPVGPSSWHSNPGALVVVDPWRKPTAVQKRLYGEGSKAASIASGGGPFVIPATDRLVHDMLTGLGYADASEPLHSEMVSLFSELNKKKLSFHGFSLRQSLDQNRQLLHSIFASDSIEQAWRCASGDTGVRMELAARGLLTDCNASRPEVFSAMASFLEERAEDAVPSTYFMRVASIRRHLDRHQVDART